MNYCKRRGFVASLALLSLLGPLFAAQDSPYTVLVREGRELMAKGDLSGAFIKGLSAIALEEKGWEAYLLCAETQRLQKLEQAAQDYFGKALEFAPDGKKDEIRKMMGAKPGLEATELIRLGEKYENEGLIFKAASTFDKAYDLDKAQHSLGLRASALYLQAQDFPMAYRLACRVRMRGGGYSDLLKDTDSEKYLKEVAPALVKTWTECIRARWSGADERVPELLITCGELAFLFADDFMKCRLMYYLIHGADEKVEDILENMNKYSLESSGFFSEGLLFLFTRESMKSAIERPVILNYLRDRNGEQFYNERKEKFLKEILDTGEIPTYGGIVPRIYNMDGIFYYPDPDNVKGGLMNRFIAGNWQKYLDDPAFYGLINACGYIKGPLRASIFSGVGIPKGYGDDQYAYVFVNDEAKWTRFEKRPKLIEFALGYMSPEEKESAVVSALINLSCDQSVRGTDAVKFVSGWLSPQDRNTLSAANGNGEKYELPVMLALKELGEPEKQMAILTTILDSQTGLLKNSASLTKKLLNDTVMRCVRIEEKEIRSSSLLPPGTRVDPFSPQIIVVFKRMKDAGIAINQPLFSDGGTALHYAAWRGALRLASALVAADRSLLNVRDSKRKRPADVMEKREHMSDADWKALRDLLRQKP